jgi:uncharacterized protein
MSIIAGSKIRYYFYPKDFKCYNIKNEKMSVSVLLILAAIGIVTGAVAGMLGIGGAIIMIPALVFLIGFSQHDAQGTSLAVMLPPIGIIAAYNYYKAGHVNLKFALILAAAFLIGSYFGSKFALTLPQGLLKKIFAVLLLLVAARMLLTK